MKRLGFTLALLALMAGSAWAQGGTVYYDGQKLTPPNSGTSAPGIPQLFTQLVGGYFAGDSSGRSFRMTTDGYLYTSDASRDRDNVLSQVMSGPSLLVAGGADSSAIVDVHPFTHLKLLLNISGAAGGKFRIAVQCREHYGSTQASDTTNTYVEMLAAQAPAYNYVTPYAPVVPRGLTQSYSKDTTGTVTQPADTLSFGHLFTGSATLPWSGEFVVTEDWAGRGPGAASAVVYSYPYNISVPLDMIYGTDHRFRYLDVRVRNLTATNSVTVMVKILGFSN